MTCLPFQVWDRNTHLYKHHILEASAGTGKTFAIENIFVRLILGTHEKEIPPQIHEILAVTFTKAATQELKGRIRKALESTLTLIKALRRGEEVETPDYLENLLERSPEYSLNAKQRLERALSHFEEAQIFTIHGFCFRMLHDYGIEANQAFHSSKDEKGMGPVLIQRIIKDFFRTQLDRQQFSPSQLHSLLAQYGHDIQVLTESIYQWIKQGIELASYPSFEESYLDFVSAIDHIKKETFPSTESIMDEFKNLAPHYQKTSDKHGNIYPALLENLHFFATLWSSNEWTRENFDLLLEMSLKAIEALDPELIKAKRNPPSSLFFEALRKHLLPIIRVASHPEVTKIRLTASCQHLLKRACNEEEFFMPQDLLTRMERACAIKSFLELMRCRYGAVIIDEFQDTDPIQWNIFKTIFFDDPQNRSLIFLVGDPKQSIYGFRGADLYTYLSAAETLGANYRHTLNTNYRSQPSLVQALNTLFSNQIIPNFIHLPRLKKSLTYQEVMAGSKEEILFNDEKKSLHFFVAKGRQERSKSWPSKEMEEGFLFPFIASEIKKLQKQISLPECAILVRDRYQADRLAAYLSTEGIPSTLRRSETLASTLAAEEMKRLLKAILNPKSHQAIKEALGGKLIGWNDLLIKKFVDDWETNPFLCERTLAQFYALKELLMAEDFAACIQTFMQSSWHEDRATVQEKILSQNGGLDLYTDCYHLVELIIEYQHESRVGGDALLLFFDQLHSWDNDEDEKIICRRNYGLQAIQILTLHMSKGLEFGVVFALGLSCRTPHKSSLFPCPTSEKIEHRLLDQNDPAYIEACEESDAEKMRLLYVAMTRAKLRLYTPLIIEESNKEIEIGAASPIELFISRILAPQLEHKALYKYLPFPLEKVESLLTSLSNHCPISYSLLDTPFLKGTSLSSDLEKIALFPPKAVTLHGQAQHLLSYTSLMRQKRNESDSISNTREEPLFLKREGNHEGLPIGNEIGNLLHKLLEVISFERAAILHSPAEMESLIKELKELPSSFNEWRHEIAHLLFNTLKTPLMNGVDSFCLADIHDSACYREMEFLFSPTSHTFLKGFADLVFWHKGKYYIIDWKSNFLGETLEDYSQDNMKNVMEKHDYYLQGSIYTQALKRYLKKVEPKSFEEVFGGVFYLFLRGITLEQGPQYGIYHFWPNLELAVS